MANKEKIFDILIKDECKIPKPIVNNIAELIYNNISHRDENCYVIYGHDKNKVIKISLHRLRFIVSKLYEEFSKKKIKPKDTVLLSSLQVNNELYMSLIFVALMSYGCRVLLPMFVETKEIENWLKITKCSHIIIPKKEILGQKTNPKYEKILNEIETIGLENKKSVFDLEEDFNVKKLVFENISDDFSFDTKIVKNTIENTNLENDAAIFTTSASSGKSKLVLYDQSGFIKCCMSWQKSGLYKKTVMGGRSLIDIFPHTISVRTFFNALWSGYPVCIFVSEWVKNKPEKILSHLIEMKPEVITIGPGSFNVVLEFLDIFPEIKNLVFSELRCVVSTGSKYSKYVSEKIVKTFDLPLYNAYGTTETQQVLTTVLLTSNDENLTSLGKPLCGVQIGLKKTDNSFYKLYVNSPFGHKEILNDETEYINGFFYTGDIVQVKENNNLFFMGRENRDFLKTSYGSKLPLSLMKEYYKNLYEKSNHIEFFNSETINLNFGVSALIFIKDYKLKKGRVIDKKFIADFKKMIVNADRHLEKNLEPFEYEQRKISRFIIINGETYKTTKGNVSRYKIELNYNDEIYDLMHSNKSKNGVCNIVVSKKWFLGSILKLPLFKISFFRRLVLKIFQILSKRKK